MIVGFCGKIGAGKDTAGAYLVDRWGFKRISFADKLKDSAAACFGIKPKDWEELKNAPDARITITRDLGPTNREAYTVASVSCREFLQFYGTEAHRKVFGDNFWVEQAIKEIPDWSFAHGQKNYVFTDVRFSNEAEAIHELGGRVLQIYKDGGSTKDVHSSEVGLPEDLIDGKIANIGSLDQLYVLLDALVDTYS